MDLKRMLITALAMLGIGLGAVAPALAQTPAKKPNILFIMGDDIGWMQPSIYHQGLMVGETPNIDRIGKEGAKFMTYYAEQSCTAGRTAFFTGMTPLRAGMIPPQLPGSPSFLQPGTPSMAKFLLDLGYTTGEFGKNHLGDHSRRCRQRTASRNSGVTSITWTRCCRHDRALSHPVSRPKRSTVPASRGAACHERRVGRADLWPFRDLCRLRCGRRQHGVLRGPRAAWFGIPPEVLPTDAMVSFREPSFWEAYRWQIALALAILIGQSLLIVALFAQRRRRRLAEAESQARLSAMAHMNRSVAMGGLAASIAHELNQPLGAIYNNAGAAQLLIKTDPPNLSEVAEILNDIKLDDKRASEVLVRIRNMLRKTAANVEELDLNEAIGETMKMLSAEASAQGVSLSTELEPGLPQVRADRVQVQQVVLNLALNAMEAMHDQPADKRQMVIRSRRIDDKQAEVSVSDSGAGIDPEMLPRIFDAFVTTKPNGMGLGLSISRSIVEAHGGRLGAHNLQSGGASIHFTVPFATAHPT